jgi:hypothetical protein
MLLQGISQTLILARTGLARFVDSHQIHSEVVDLTFTEGWSEDFVASTKSNQDMESNNSDESG